MQLENVVFNFLKGLIWKKKEKKRKEKKESKESSPNPKRQSLTNQEWDPKINFSYKYPLTLLIWLQPWGSSSWRSCHQFVSTEKVLLLFFKY